MYETTQRTTTIETAIRSPLDCHAKEQNLYVPATEESTSNDKPNEMDLQIQPNVVKN